MRVLSLFDGHGGGHIALDALGVAVDQYYTSEINKWAAGVAEYLHPDIIQLGDVRNISYNKSVSIDAIIGGSPCTDLSFSGKQAGLGTATLEQYTRLKRMGFEFKGQSYLFWEYMRLIKEVEPQWFLLENVRMSKVNQDIMSSHIGFDPVVFNSNTVSAQNRYRIYWVGKRNDQGGYDKVDVEVPSELGSPIVKDIVHEYNTDDASIDLSPYIVPFSDVLHILNHEVARAKIGYYRKDSQANRVYTIHGKSITLTGNSGGGAAKMGQYLFGDVTPLDEPMPFTDPARINKTRNGQRISNSSKFYTLTVQDRHGVMVEGYVRKLTPIETERLQTLDDDTTKWGLIGGRKVEISNAQRYGMTGNGWTNKVIQSIMEQVMR
jgi:DNA (cytosine-5)-methyltransferase 3A